MTPQRSTYHAECLCGAHIVSFERETRCEKCGRQLVFEWGHEPILVAGMKAPATMAAADPDLPVGKPKAMAAGA